MAVEFKTLPYGPLVTGMPVIANHTEQPCAQLVAVISRIGRAIEMHYLSMHSSIRYFYGSPFSATPLSCFGVAIQLNEDAGTFCCVPIENAKLTAHYRDGSPRNWQPWGDPDQNYRKGALKHLDRSYVL